MLHLFRLFVDGLFVSNPDVHIRMNRPFEPISTPEEPCQPYNEHEPTDGNDSVVHVVLVHGVGGREYEENADKYCELEIRRTFSS